MKKILVPIDGSECSNLAIDQALELAKKFDSELTLFHVDESSASFSFAMPGHEGLNSGAGGSPGMADQTGFPIPVDFSNELTKRAEGIVESAKARCMALGDKVEAISLQGKAADMIIDHVENSKYDLVIMGSYGMSGLRRFFLGSVTHKVAVAIDSPILIVR